MPPRDLDIAQQFPTPAEDALRTGGFEPVVPLDVECVTPQDILRGIEAIEAISGKVSRYEMRFDS